MGARDSRGRDSERDFSRGRDSEREDRSGRDYESERNHSPDNGHHNGHHERGVYDDDTRRWEPSVRKVEYDDSPRYHDSPRYDDEGMNGGRKESTRKIKLPSGESYETRRTSSNYQD